MIKFSKEYFFYIQIASILFLMIINSILYTDLIIAINILTTLLVAQYIYRFVTITLKGKSKFKISGLYLLLIFTSFILMFYNVHMHWSMKEFLVLFINLYVFTFITIVGLILNYFRNKESHRS